MSNVAKAINMLTDGVHQQALNTQVLIAQTLVNTVAIHAMVEVHPDPKAFAKAFAAIWLRRGEPHLHDDLAGALIQALDSELTALEAVLAQRGVQLTVRAPRPS
jgi:hypothetical protein